MADNNLVFYRGVAGVGVNIPDEQVFLYNSTGENLAVRGLWHLEISTVKHIYLTRTVSGMKLNMKVFKVKDNKMERAGIYVELDEQQTADLIYALPTLIRCCQRSDIAAVSSLSSISFLSCFKKKCS
jgi:hypothetical protein